MSTNRTFWTDSNGLGMLKRVLDERPDYNITEGDDYQIENVTANYYPVDSAIYIEGNGLRMTVLNDRAEGGTSLRDGQIELMQNRKIPADDHKGVGEWLLELDESGKGMRVKASYQLLINKPGNQDRPSAQRTHQSVIDQPLQLFFSDDATQGSATQTYNIS
jgi:hypothetical protein